MVLKKNWLLILIALIVFSGLLVRYLDRVPRRNYCDFRVYYKAGQDLIKGKNIYYREKESITPFKYSPFFALVFAPLSLLPIKASAAVFFALNYISIIFFFRLSYHLVRHSIIFRTFSDREVCLVYFLVIFCTIRHIFLVLDSGQVNIIMCALVLAGLSCVNRGKDVLAGAFLAASILIKYTPAVFLPYFILRQRSKVVFWTVLSIILFLMLPALVVGAQKEMFYLLSWFPSIISTSLDKFSYIYSRNQSIFSAFIRFLSPTECNVQFFSLSFDQALFYGRMAGLFIYLFVLLPGISKERDRVIDFSLLLICLSLFNPNGWDLNFVSLLLPIMLLVQYLVSVRGRDLFILVSLITAFLSLNIMSKDILGEAAVNYGYAHSFTTFGALIIYVSLLKLKFFDKEFL